MDTFTEYMETVSKTVARLTAVTGVQWNHGWTGGNCDAYFLNQGEDKQNYFMVTVDACAPTTDEEWEVITLGYYTPDNDEGTIIEAVTNWDSLVDYFTDGNPHAYLHDLPYVEND